MSIISIDTLCRWVWEEHLPLDEVTAGTKLATIFEGEDEIIALVLTIIPGIDDRQEIANRLKEHGIDDSAGTISDLHGVINSFGPAE